MGRRRSRTEQLEFERQRIAQAEPRRISDLGRRAAGMGSELRHAMDTLLQDLRFAARKLRAKPGFTLLAAATLALGIGGSTATFSLVSAVLLKALPFHDPDRLFMVWEDATVAGFPRNDVAPGNYASLRSQNRVFEGMAAVSQASFNLSGDGEPLKVEARKVTADFFPLLGIAPELGRAFRPEEDKPGVESRRDPEPRPLAVALRTGPGCRRPGHPPERREVRRDRCPAEGLPVHGELRRPVGAGGVRRRGAGEPRRALPDRRRPDSARRHPGGGGRRPCGHRHARLARLPRRGAGSARLHAAAAGAADGRRAPPARHPFARGRGRAADRLRQPRGAPARPSGIAGPRDRRPHGARRGPGADRASAAHRERAALAARHAAGAARGGLDAQLPRAAGPARPRALAAPDARRSGGRWALSSSRSRQDSCSGSSPRSRRRGST